MALPANQRNLEVVEQLTKLADEAGISLIELAIAFVINHPGVTSAIIAPAHDGAARVPAVRGRHHLMTRFRECRESIGHGPTQRMPSNPTSRRAGPRREALSR